MRPGARCAAPISIRTAPSAPFEPRNGGAPPGERGGERTWWTIWRLPRDPACATSATLTPVEDPDLAAMPGAFTPKVPFDECFDAQYGLEVVSGDVEGEGVVRARVPVRDVLLTDLGVVHGGVFASAAEALASRGTAISVIPRGFMAMGQSNDTNILELISEGVIHVEARVVSRGEDAWVWTVDARDEDGRACALSRVTVAIRPLDGLALS